ncbi:hypothetical protein JTE90_024846 [Oedothorax gibbosus]|uniref:Protein-cysteine N-palmitoyltransferase Rasp n=1 Tax=Oedothorax gibbosus TaxID=931172 RepID=A0AAV6U808_9ARAC|nr:hypothetical protein JTE90_024846 [Oedothorax gibbosus]
MWSERSTYLAVWIVSISAALTCFSKSTKYHPAVYPDDFEKGWRFLHRLQDRSDIEWTVLTSLFKEYWFLLVVQMLCTNVLFRRTHEARILFYAVYSIFSITLIVGIATSIVFLMYIIIAFCAGLTGKKGYCYLLTFTSLFFVHSTRFFNLKEYLSIEKERDLFLFDVGWAWLSAKCLSFSVDRIDAKRNYSNASDILMVLAYCLYLPAFFTGPMISYESFCKDILNNKKEPLSLKDILLNCVYIVYQLSFYFIYEFLLHFVYSSSISYYPEIVSNFDRWSLCGLCYALPMMFYLKYFILFGIAGSLSRLEGVKFPPPPKCFTTTHLASLLSRHFDRGLYLWLLKYLYLPLLKLGLGRIFAQSVCFTFVAVWHGSDAAICTSSALNCFLVTSEAIAKHISTSKMGKKFKKLPLDVRDRFHAALATPHFILLCISVTFFLSNYEIGVLVLNRMLLGFELVPLATLSCIMYCGCHVSINAKKFYGKEPISMSFILGKCKR